MADIEDIVMRLVQNYMSGRYSERHGLVTSYDSKKHLAKVMYQPEGFESGWLPIHTGHIGQNYGIVAGLQPGSGGTQGGSSSGSSGGSSGGSGGQSQAMGDQVIVQFQEGDFDAGKITSRVHSDQDQPPEAKSGEMIFWSKFKQDNNPGPDAADSGQSNSDGQTIFFKNDGSLNDTDGSGAVRTLDGKGNYTVTAL